MVLPSLIRYLIFAAGPQPGNSVLVSGKDENVLAQTERWDIFIPRLRLNLGLLLRRNFATFLAQ